MADWVVGKTLDGVIVTETVTSDAGFSYAFKYFFNVFDTVSY